MGGVVRKNGGVERTFAIHRMPVHNLGIGAHEVHLPEGVFHVHLTPLRTKVGETTRTHDEGAC